MVKQKPKVVLVTIPQEIYFGRSKHEMHPNNAIVSLVKWAKKFGYDVQFYDIDMRLPSKKEIFNYFKNNNPNIIGMSGVVSTSYNQVKELSKIMRKACPSSLIILGGHMTAAANTILRKTEVNICILGDGEKSFVNLIKYVEKNRTTLNTKKLLKIKGLAFINKDNEMEFTGYGERIPSSDLQNPDYEILSSGVPRGYDVLQNYWGMAKDSIFFQNDPDIDNPNINPKCAKIWVTKGCIGRCTFCQRFTLGFQTYDLKNVEKYVKELKEKYKIKYIAILGENFIANKKFCYEVAKILKKHGMSWGCQGVRPNMVTLEDLKFFNKCGCAGIKYGIETGSPKMLKIIEKRVTVEDIFNALKNTKSVNMSIGNLYFCMAMPGETDKTITESAELLAKIAIMMNTPPSNLQVGNSYALPLPGSPLYEYGQLQGVIERTVEGEEGYLNYISDMHDGKDQFINLTGQSVKRALFWEFLFMYEAMKLYYSKKKKSDKLNKKSNNNSSEKVKEERPFFRQLKRYNVKKLFSLATKKPISVLNTFLCNSKSCIYIPRSILYPLMRNLVYLEYIMQNLPAHIKGIFGNKKDFIFKYQYKKHKYKVNLCEGKSLRQINEMLRKKHPLARTLTQRNQQILYLGR